MIGKTYTPNTVFESLLRLKRRIEVVGYKRRVLALNETHKSEGFEGKPSWAGRSDT